MKAQEKSKIVLKAAKRGKKDRRFSRTRIDPKGKGANIRRLERGEKVSEQKLNEMCVYILQTEGKEVPSSILLSKKEDTTDKTKQGKNKANQMTYIFLEEYQGLKKRVIQLESALSILDKKLDNYSLSEEKIKASENNLSKIDKFLDKQKILEEKVNQLESFLPKLDKKDGTKKVLGFSIVQKTIQSGNKKYLKWYAYKQIDGKLKWVYIGDDISKAKEKISQWLEKRQQNE